MSELQPEYFPQTTVFQPKNLKLSDARRLCKEKPMVDIIKNCIRQGGYYMFVSPPKCGKTWVIYDFVITVTTGGNRRWLGTFELVGDPRNVLIIDEEMTHSGFAPRMDQMTAGDEVEQHVTYWDKAGFKLDRPECITHLIKTIIDLKIDIIIIDSLVRVHSKNENDNSEMSKVLASLNPILEMGVTVIMLHHTPKNSSGSRGAGDLVGQIDGIFELSKSGDIYTMQQTNARGVADEDLTRVSFKIPGLTGDPITIAPLRSSTTGYSLLGNVLEFIKRHPGCSQKDILDGVIGKNTSIREELGRSEAGGLILKKRDLIQKNRFNYTLVDVSQVAE